MSTGKPRKKPARQAAAQRHDDHDGGQEHALAGKTVPAEDGPRPEPARTDVFISVDPMPQVILDGGRARIKRFQDALIRSVLQALKEQHDEVHGEANAAARSSFHNRWVRILPF